MNSEKNVVNDPWNGCKFFYFRNVFLPKSNAHVTVAFRVLDTNEEHVVYECQSAFSSPRERFCKKLGRNIASGRLNKTPLRRVIQNDRSIGLFRNVIRDVQECALAELVELHNPSWWEHLRRQKEDALKYLRYVSEGLSSKEWKELAESDFDSLSPLWEK